MSDLHGFTLEQNREIAELNTEAYLYRHAATGAHLLSLVNDDENKVFGITFRTPRADSTGIAHILEHSVLGGSQKYPLKEPFLQLLKGSLKTFLNAITFPDRTVYPVASTNLKDFYNLVDVYLDAVFHPLITPQHLQQEGWHYALDDADAPLQYRGIVYNEMKGSYSSPDSRLYQTSKQSLFPDTVYGFDSGGDPRVIPQLTYEQFTDFHRRYYHPANALVYFYGDDDPIERLRLLNDVLSKFEPSPVDVQIALQPHFDAPKTITQAYGVDKPANGDGSSDNKTFVQLNWVLNAEKEPEQQMGLSLLSYCLISTQASPLRKALIDSGLGEDITGGGFSSSLRQMTFSVGMRGVQAADTGKVEEVILSTLSSLAETGFEEDMVEAGYNTIEFSLRENNTGSFPRGLNLMVRALQTWTYGNDPMDAIAFEAPLAHVRAQLDSNPRYLQDMIREQLLENTHRTTVILTPDPELNERLAQAEATELDKARRQFAKQDLQDIVANTAALRRRQEAPDPPELLATLPSLQLTDLDPKVQSIPIEIGAADGATVLYHDLFTNGIAYLDLGFDMQSVPAVLLPYAKLFSRTLVEMGTETQDFVKLSQRIGRHTGGISPSILLSSSRHMQTGVARLLLSGKSTMAKTDELLNILADILLHGNLDDRERFKQIVLKSKAGLESSLIPRGHSVVGRRLRAAYNPSAWAREQISGIDYLAFLRGLLSAIESDWPTILEKLETVRSLLVNRTSLIANITLDAENWESFHPQLHNFLQDLPTREQRPVTWGVPDQPQYEALAMPAQVNYVGKGTDLYALGYKLHGSINVISNYLRTGYLWDNVRVRGGAYGAFCAFDKQSGLMTFLSYRDPNLQETLRVYDKAADFLRTLNLDSEDLRLSIIGAISNMDSYQLPDAKGYSSMLRYLLHETDEIRQRIRDEVLATSQADFRRFAGVLAAGLEQARVVTLGSAEAIERANEELAKPFAVTKVL